MSTYDKVRKGWFPDAGEYPNMSTEARIFARSVIDADMDLARAQHRYHQLLEVDPDNAAVGGFFAQTLVEQMRLAGAALLLRSTQPDMGKVSLDGLVVRAYLIDGTERRDGSDL